MNPFKVINPVSVTKGAFGIVAGAGRMAVSLLDREKTQVSRTPGEDPPAYDDPRDRLPGADIVAAQPQPPAEPPVDVVGEALAGDQEPAGSGGGGAHEPRGSTREEEHGETPLRRAEADEIAEEATEVDGRA